MRSPALPLPVPLLLACCLCLGANDARGDEEPAKPAPPRHDVTVPVGFPVQLDGRMPPAEWADARGLLVGEDASALRVKQSRGTLLLGLELSTRWIPGSSLWLMFTPDEEGAGLYEEGAVRLDFEPLEHSRAHLLAYRKEGPVEVFLEDAAIGRAELSEFGATVEIAIRLGALGVTKDAAAPVRFALLFARPRGRSNPTWPPGLSMKGPPGKPPPGLVSSATWGRLLGWQEPGGPGAFPITEWTRWLEEDRELTRRGRDAHAFGLLITEEPQARKRDVEQIPAVVGNLKWIAEREPLTPNDLLLLAKTYRFLNRTDEALATLDTLDAFPVWRGNDLVHYERALCLRSAGRYAEAADLWDALAARSKSGRRDQYEATAAQERERLAAWEEEQALRHAAERSTHLPLVQLVTPRGSVVVLLHADDVADSVAHFLALVDRTEDGRSFYAGTLFHRVVGEFLVQGGDPLTKTDGCDAGGPGVGPAQVDVEVNPRHGFWRGALGFARGPDPLNGSQFFILTSPRPRLGERNFTCFGHVVAGMDVVDRLEMCDELLDVRVIRRGTPRPPDEADPPPAPPGADPAAPKDEEGEE